MAPEIYRQAQIFVVLLLFMTQVGRENNDEFFKQITFGILQTDLKTTKSRGVFERVVVV
jgi:hypothetical protein